MHQDTQLSLRNFHFDADNPNEQLSSLTSYLQYVDDPINAPYNQLSKRLSLFTSPVPPDHHPQPGRTTPVM